jgi:predicted GNAT family acetyltransferase
MIADLSALVPAPAAPEGVEVSEVSPTDTGDWLHLVSWRYGLDTSTSAYLRDVFCRALEGATRMWIARVDGVPASKTGLHIDKHGVAGIYGVATTEQGRNRGLASLLTLTALNAAKQAGVTTAVLHSTPMARSLYRRLGFEDVGVFEAWARPDTLHL